MLQGTDETQQRSRALRQHMSPPEIRLWLALRNRPAGLKFRRQHPAGPYTTDFYCHAARMIVEVDGSAHDFGDRPERDMARDDWFEACGFAVLRVTAGDVLRDCEAVIAHISTTASARLKDQE